MKKRTLFEPNWTPRHMAGGVYCSPACGGECLLSAFKAAHQAARAAAEQLGPGWRVDVFENLGWYWRVRRGPVEVGKSPRGMGLKRSQTYWATFSMGIYSWTLHGATPREAVKNVAEKARDEAGMISNAALGVRKWMKRHGD